MATIAGSTEQSPQRERFSPQSEFIEHVEYDKKNYTMDVYFRSGTVKRYLYCFPATWQTFKESPTHDVFFSKAIRGRLTSVTIKSNSIGRQTSHPLKALKKRRTLDEGIKRNAGTVARAGL